MIYHFDEEKSFKLKRERGVSFEDIVQAIGEGKVIKIFNHPNREKYSLQKIMYVEIEGYIWVVPFLKDGDTLILKTAYPSRKATAKCLKMRSEETKNAKDKL